MHAKIILPLLLLSACTTQERIKLVHINVPVPVRCPAADDVPTKPDKPALPDGLEAALRVAVAHAARLSGWGDDLAGRLGACSQVSSDP
jgi:hypothetical protein